MSIEDLCDHRGVIYRPRTGAEEVRDELGDVLPVFDALPAPTGLNCRPNQSWSGNLEDRGPGERQGSTQQWFLLPDFSVRERDVLSVESGPLAGLLLRIHSVSPCTDPEELHHYEVTGERWQGSVVDEEDGS